MANDLRKRAAELLRRDAGEDILRAAGDMTRTGLSNIVGSVVAVRKALIAYDRALSEADALDCESAAPRQTGGDK